MTTQPETKTPGQNLKWSEDRACRNGFDYDLGRYSPDRNAEGGYSPSIEFMGKTVGYSENGFESRERAKSFCQKHANAVQAAIAASGRDKQEVLKNYEDENANLRDLLSLAEAKLEAYGHEPRSTLMEGIRLALLAKQEAPDYADEGVPTCHGTGEKP